MLSSTKDDTVQSLRNSAQNIKDDARATAGEAKSQMRDTANKMGRTVRGFIDSTGEEISHAADTVKHQIQEKPVQSALVTLGVGFVLGLLFRRS